MVLRLFLLLINVFLAACRSKFAKVACQLIVEQMHLMLAAVPSGSDGESICSTSRTFIFLNVYFVSLAPLRSKSQGTVV
jgi:hypothetical protein